MNLVVPCLFLIAIIIVLVLLFSKKQEVRSHWHHTFDQFQFSTMDFYASVREALGKRNIKGVQLSETVHQEGSIIDPWRKYLRIRRNEYVFDVCAAPIGEGYFVSWWLVEEFGFKTRLFKFFPMLGRLFDVMTYYRVDDEKAYRDLVHASVMEAIEGLSGSTGFRALTEQQKQIPLSVPK